MKYNVSADFLPDNTNTDITVQNNTVTLSNGSEITLVKAEGHPNLYRAITNGTTIPVILHTNSKGDVEITMRGYKYQLQVHDERNVKFLTMLKSSAGNQNSAQKVVAPMPGLLKQLFVSKNQISWWVFFTFTSFVKLYFFVNRNMTKLIEWPKP